MKKIKIYREGEIVPKGIWYATYYEDTKQPCAIDYAHYEFKIFKGYGKIYVEISRPDFPEPTIEPEIGEYWEVTFKPFGHEIRKYNGPDVKLTDLEGRETAYPNQYKFIKQWNRPKG